MKDKIIRLRFTRQRQKKIVFKSDDLNGGIKYEIYWNTNEDAETLDMSIHELGTTETSKKFAYSINTNNTKNLNQTLNQVNIFEEDVVIKSGKSSSAIYQFSINFTELFSKENILTFYDVTDSDFTTAIGTLEFFAETEDSFKTVRLDRPGIEPTTDQPFWDAIQKLLWADIKNHILRFSEYEKFIDTILCSPDTRPDPVLLNNKQFDRENSKRRSPFIKSEEYNLIKFATNYYMLAKFRLDPTQLSGYLGSTNRLPYYDIIIDRIKDDATVAAVLDGEFNSDSDCERREFNRLYNPIMIELIWSYWMEQGMLMQTMNVINLRFQNIKGSAYIDRLMRFDTDPLRPLSHILWGYIQDEQHRLSLPRRLNEYDHEYGLTLTGRAVPRINPVDSRVKFLEAFHSLLTQSLIYFKESDDTTRIADAFPILNSLKEVHLLLAEGNHNAYGNLTWTARQEMMMQQYILSRPEMREFLGGRIMVPYPETWMDRVDTMRNIQGWGGTSIVHYYELAIHGELILLSIRYGNWSDVTLDRNNAANWAQTFRNSIQRYVHAYRAVTGVDLSVDQVIQLPNTFAIQPAFLIQQRMIEERIRTRRA